MKSSKPKRLNVLLLDDEEMILNLNELVLSESFNIFKAKNISQALNLIHLHDIQITICDHYIGNEDGLNFLIKIHQDYPDIIKIIFSSCTCHNVIIESHNSQAIFKYLAKPCSNDELLENTKLAALTWEISRYQKHITKEHSSLKESISSINLIEVKSIKKVQSLKKIAAKVTQGIIYIGVGALLTGTISMLILYCIKSLLGFDIFK
ncbi:MAG: response regulator [Lentisphaeraceae bacterium]|nr:response regulator [Lentisphaeraceae bacterium]